MRKKFIKKGDVHSHPQWRNVECAMSSTRRVVKIAERYEKKIHVLHVTTKEEVEFFSYAQKMLLLKQHHSILQCMLQIVTIN